MSPSLESLPIAGSDNPQGLPQTAESLSSGPPPPAAPLTQIKKTPTGLGARGSKTWPYVFFGSRPVRDRPFVETVKQKGPGVDLLSAFLQDTDASGPSWEVEQARCFCLETLDVPDARIWVDDRTSSDLNKRQSPNWTTSADYRKSPPQQMSVCNDDDVHRRLTFVPILTSNIIKALMETSTWYEAQTLRPAVRQHISGETSIRVYIPMAGFPIFRLSMHLPYLLLKKSKDERMVDEQGKKLWNDLSFLPLSGHWSIYEAQTTVIISGAHHYDWHGYAFGNPGPKDAHDEEYKKERDDASDAGEDDDEDDDDGPDFFEEEEDVFATGGCEPVTNPGNVIWDPRVYFLRTLQIRLAVVVQANEYLVQKLAAGVRLWKIQEKGKEVPGSAADPQAQDEKLRRALEGISNMTDLFQLLRERFSKANTVWDKFDGKRGDVLYFADLQDSGAKSALHKIEESFEKMKNLELTLARLQHTCEQSANLLALRLSHQGHEMSRKMTLSHQKVISLTSEAVESAAKSQKAGEDTSRATRVNVQLFTVTTAFIVALQYFCSDRDLFQFERSPRTFWISISVLVPGLMILTLALHTFDELKEVLTSRVTGKLKKVATPTIQPDSPA